MEIPLPIVIAAGEIPEAPNFLTLIEDYLFDTPWAALLYNWESIIFAILIGILISLFFYWGCRNNAMIPTGIQNFLELITEGMNDVIYGILGEDGKKYLPFLGTLFIYIFSMNVFGMIPLMKSPSSDINITFALAICVFLLVQFLNIRNMGFFGFLYHLAGEPKNGIGWVLAPVIFFIELITQLSRPITLSLRLFGNILGEKILVGAFALFGIAILAPLNSPVGLPLQIPFMLLGLLTSLMQALVFTLLSAVYILLSVPHEEEEH